MLKKIEALRKEPKHVRNQYAFWIALIVTLLILVLWGSTFPARFQAQEPATDTSVAETSYMDSIGTLFESVVSQFGAVTATTETAPNTPERIDFVELVASSSVHTESDTATTASTTETLASSTATTSAHTD